MVNSRRGSLQELQRMDRTSVDYVPLAWSPAARPTSLRTWLRSRCGTATAALSVAILLFVVIAASSPSQGGTRTHLRDWSQNLMGGGSSSGPTGHPSTTLRSDETYTYAVPDPNVEGSYAEHPIHGLIREGKEQWALKVARQSKTYEAAVREYKRRYRREPPPGFDKWFEWAQKHDVQLLDEYDSLYRQIEPMLGVRPQILKERVDAYRDKKGRGRDHGLITVKDGVITVGEGWRPAVTEGFAELMQPVAHLIPDVVVPLYLHDAASATLDWRARQGYQKAAREGYWVNESELPVELEHESVWTKRERQCSPDSPYRRLVIGLDTKPTVGGPAFIRNHTNAMSYCMAPQIADMHGSLAQTADIQNLLPSFALSTHEWNSDVLWTPPILYDLNPKNESPFREKGHKLLWRGSPDGISVTHDKHWRQSHRFRLLTLLNSNDTEPRIVRQTKWDHFGREYQVDVQHTLAELNDRYSDVRATGGPVQCAPDICKHLKETMTFVPKASLEEMADHRYVMDVDGNAYSARFRAHLQSNQLPFKSTIFPGWFMDRIQPWVHYVPVRVDYADLYDVLAFFDGGLDAARTGNHDDLAEEIAMAGSDWAHGFWRLDDMRAYTLRLLLEWARVFDPARKPTAQLELDV